MVVSAYKAALDALAKRGESGAKSKLQEINEANKREAVRDISKQNALKTSASFPAQWEKGKQLSGSVMTPLNDIQKNATEGKLSAYNDFKKENMPAGYEGPSLSEWVKKPEWTNEDIFNDAYNRGMVDSSNTKDWLQFVNPGIEKEPDNLNAAASRIENLRGEKYDIKQKLDPYVNMMYRSDQQADDLENLLWNISQSKGIGSDYFKGYEDVGGAGRQMSDEDLMRAVKYFGDNQGSWREKNKYSDSYASTMDGYGDLSFFDKYKEGQFDTALDYYGKLNSADKQIASLYNMNDGKNPITDEEVHLGDDYESSAITPYEWNYEGSGPDYIGALLDLATTNPEVFNSEGVQRALLQAGAGLNDMSSITSDDFDIFSFMNNLSESDLRNVITAENSKFRNDIYNWDNTFYWDEYGNPVHVDLSNNDDWAAWRNWRAQQNLKQAYATGDIDMINKVLGYDQGQVYDDWRRTATGYDYLNQERIGDGWVYGLPEQDIVDMLPALATPVEEGGLGFDGISGYNDMDEDQLALAQFILTDMAYNAYDSANPFNVLERDEYGLPIDTSMGNSDLLSYLKASNYGNRS